jgi:FAD/FMN-containing dehydrogenase
MRDPQAAVELLDRLQTATGGLVSAFELIPRLALELVQAHIPDTRDPLPSPSPWYVLAEATSAGKVSLRDAFQETIAEAIEARLASNAAVAANEMQRHDLWRLRENISEAQKREGASIKHDISVPVKDIPAFLAQGCALVAGMVPGVRPVPFGHIGDGNIHFNFTVPNGGNGEAFLARWGAVSHAVHDLVNGFGGSISAEHGVGVMKREDILRYKSATEMDLMRTLKRTLDPNNILNPGKVV